MRSKRSRALLGALTLLLLACTITLLLPQLIKHRVQQRLQEYPTLEYRGLHVTWQWTIHIQQLRAKHPRATLACENLRITPRLRTPHIRNAHIPRCKAELHPNASSPSDDKPTPKHSSKPRDLRPALHALHRALAPFQELQVDHIDLREDTDDNAQRARIETLHYQPQSGPRNTHPTLRATLHIDARTHDAHIRAHDLHLNIDWLPDAPHARLTPRQPLHVERGNTTWRIAFEGAELQDGTHISIPEAQIFNHTENTLIARLQDLRIHEENHTPNLYVQRGELHLPSLHLDALFEPETRAKSPPHIAHPPNENSASKALVIASSKPPANKDEDTDNSDVLDDDDLWSLRLLERTRYWARALRKASALEGESQSIYLALHNLEILHEQKPWMTLKHAQIQPDAPPSVHLRIADADLSVDADPRKDNAWNISVQNAPLQRVAEGLELAPYPQGSADATLRLHHDNDALHIDGRLALHHAVLTHPSVSPDAVGPIDAQGQLRATFPEDATRETHLHSQILVNTLPLELELRATPRAQNVRFQGHIALQRAMPCADIWAAIPTGLTPELPHDAVTFRGEMQPHLALKYDAGNFDSFTLQSTGVPGKCSLNIKDNVYDPNILDNENFIHHVQEGVTKEDIFVGPGTDAYAQIDTLPPYLPALMYLSEEIDFYTNHAVSIGLINRGIRHSLPRKRFAYGGSTVTQQLVKNLFFSRTKILTRKFQEAIVAWAMTDALSKDRILELYLNCIEFGPNLYGIVRAAEHYFNKAPHDLSALEAAWLASLKPSPKRGARDFKRGYSDYDNWNSRRIETLLHRLAHYTDHLLEEDVATFAPFVVYFPNSPNAGAMPPDLPQQPSTHTDDRHTNNAPDTASTTDEATHTKNTQ